MHATNEPANDHHSTPAAEVPLARLSADWINDWHLMLDLRPKGVPNAYWRSLKTLKTSARVAWSTGLLLSLGCLLVSGPPTIILSGIFMMAAPGLLDGIRSGYSIWKSKNRFSQVLSASDCKICTDCGYVLTGLSPAHSCPGCGGAYDFASLRDTWEDWLYGTNRNSGRSGCQQRLKY